MVERFNVDWEYDHGTPRLMRIPSSSGPFVTYYDYATLEARLAGRVKVKSLEWGPYHNPVFAGPDIAVASFSVFGLQLYQAQRDPQGPGFIVFLAPKYGTEFWSSKGHADLEEAKAAAQADFEHRILSTLEATPPAPKVTDEACPDCGRAKAKSADDAAKGFCPKHWAITDSDADRDCERHSAAALTAAQEAGR